LLLEGLNTAREDQGYARSQMLKVSGHSTPTWAAGRGFHPRGSLRLLRDFTGDIAPLKAAVERFNPQLAMTPGEYHLRLAVGDTHTGFIGTTEIPLKLASE